MSFENILLKGISFKDVRNIVEIYDKKIKENHRCTESLRDITCEYFGITYEEYSILF